MGTATFSDAAQMYAAIASMSYQDKVNNGRADAEIIQNYFENVGGLSYQEAEIFMLKIASSVISLDGKLSAGEHRMFCDIFRLGMSFDELLGLLNAQTVSAINGQFYKMMAEAPNSVQTAFLVLTIVLASSDGELAHEELLHIQNLMDSIQ